MGSDLLGIAFFAIFWIFIFFKGFSFLIEESPRKPIEERVGLVMPFIAFSTFLMWYYAQWYETIADKPGATPLLLMIALGLARYKHRDLFTDNDTP